MSNEQKIKEYINSEIKKVFPDQTRKKVGELLDNQYVYQNYFRKSSKAVPPRTYYDKLRLQLNMIYKGYVSFDSAKRLNSANPIALENMLITIAIQNRGLPILPEPYDQLMLQNNYYPPLKSKHDIKNFIKAYLTYKNSNADVKEIVGFIEEFVKMQKNIGKTKKRIQRFLITIKAGMQDADADFILECNDSRDNRNSIECEAE